ncbi:MAG: glycosyltransferase, partial [Actinobacteria bacterium]|nr:glycosyltransferase [Actinomycetota bacterium]
AASAVTVTYDFDLTGVATLMRNASAIAPHGPFVIVDNGPPGSLPSDLAERIAPDNSAGVTVLPYQGNRGFGAGCNAGVEAAQVTPFILLVNPDAEITVGMVDELLATFAANPRLGIASPQLLDHTGAPVETAGTFPTVLGLALGKFRRPGRRAPGHGHPREWRIAMAPGHPLSRGTHLFPKPGALLPHTPRTPRRTLPPSCPIPVSRFWPAPVVPGTVRGTRPGETGVTVTAHQGFILDPQNRQTLLSVRKLRGLSLYELPE